MNRKEISNKVEDMNTELKNFREFHEKEKTQEQINREILNVQNTINITNDAIIEKIKDEIPIFTKHKSVEGMLSMRESAINYLEYLISLR